VELESAGGPSAKCRTRPILRHIKPVYDQSSLQKLRSMNVQMIGVFLGAAHQNYSTIEQHVATSLCTFYFKKLHATADCFFSTSELLNLGIHGARS